MNEANILANVISRIGLKKVQIGSICCDTPVTELLVPNRNLVPPYYWTAQSVNMKVLCPFKTLETPNPVTVSYHTC